MKKVIIIAIILAIVGAIGVYLYVFKKPARTGDSGKALYTVTVKELTGEFENNEQAANAKYLNKIIKVNGTVESVTESENETSVYLKDSGSTVGVTCSFDKNELEKASVTKGQQVSVQGICSGYLMDVVLNKCVLEATE